MAPAAARWRRPPEPEPDDSFEIGDHDRGLVDDLAAAANDSSARWAWGVGALVLALLLAVQLAHHNRLQLARGATVGPALREVYSSLGMPLPPNWNLAAFELRQWGANESAPSSAGAMTVRASLKNGAAFAQPMPLLRLELEDRFGGTVARRDFQPAEYLKVPRRRRDCCPQARRPRRNSRSSAPRRKPSATGSTSACAMKTAWSGALSLSLQRRLRARRHCECADRSRARAVARAAPHRHRTLPARGPRAAGAHGRRDGSALPSALSPVGRSACRR